MDPDIVAALDDALDLDDPDNILDDDFILQVLVKSVYSTCCDHNICICYLFCKD